MQKEQYFEDQPILSSDLQLAESSKEDAIKQRQRDLLDPGIIIGSQLAGEASAMMITQGPNSGLFVTVNTGVAVSPIAERIVISSLTPYSSVGPSTMTDNGIGGVVLTPQSTGSLNIPVVNNAINWIWVGYLETTDTTVFTISEGNNSRLFVKHDDGYVIQVTQTSANPDATTYVLTAQVTCASGVVVLINTTNFLQPATFIGTIPASPYSLALPVLNNLPTDLDRPNSIPTIPGFSYVATLPGPLQFSVNFTTGVVQFNAADTTAAITISYQVLNVCIQNSVTTGSSVGAQLHLDQPTPNYALGSEITLTSHVNAYGTGNVTPHNPHGIAPADIGLAGVDELGAVLADSGIITPTGNASSTVSSLSPTAVFQALPPSANIVTIFPLTAGEFVNMGGTIISSVNIPAVTVFNFINPNTLAPLPASTYFFYIDPTLHTIQKATALPVGAFPIASIVWNGSTVVLPIQDLREFGTTGKNNIALETLLALSAGAATDNRNSSMFNAKLVGSTAVTPPTYAFTGLGGTTLNLTTDSISASVTFPTLPVNTTMAEAVAAIASAIPNVTAIAAPGNFLKILSPVSLVITGGSAAPILGFPVSPAPGSSSSGNIKEIRILGSSSATAVSGVIIAAEIDFSYDISGNLTQSVGFIGNHTLTTNITYNADSSVKTVQEIVV